MAAEGALMVDGSDRGGAGGADRGPRRGDLPSGVRPVGILSAVLTAVWTAWFMIAFIPWLSSEPSWTGVSAYAARFQPLPYLAWAIPCLLLAITFPILMLVVHSLVRPERRFWTGLGALFGALYGGVLGAVYWVLVVVVPARIASGDLEGLAPLIVVSPHSTANALEYLGYTLMGLSTIFAGLGFGPGPEARWVRTLLIADGVGGIFGGVAVLAGAWVLGMIGLLVWAVALPAASLLLAARLLRAGSGTLGPGPGSLAAATTARAGPGREGPGVGSHSGS